MGVYCYEQYSSIQDTIQEEDFSDLTKIVSHINHPFF